MKLIYYDEAAKILGVSIDVLRQAAARGDLTRAGTEGNRQRLIKEQIMLFIGTNPRTGRKRRISCNALSMEEKALWNRYAEELHNPIVTTSTVNEEMVRRAISEETSTIADAVKEEIVRNLMASLGDMLHPKAKAVAPR